MEQLKLFYQNITYCNETQDYYYHGIQEAYGICEDIILYNPKNGGSTLSSNTLEEIVKSKSI
jgi:hypothetical protein